MNVERLMDVVQTYGPIATKGLFDVSGMEEMLGRAPPSELSTELEGPGLVRVGAAVACCLTLKFGLVEDEICAESDDAVVRLVD